MKNCAEAMPSFWQPRYIRLSRDRFSRTATNKVEIGVLKAQGVVDAWDRLGTTEVPVQR